MTVKLVEIRDSATCIPAMAVHLRNRDEAEFFLLRAGYSKEQIGGREDDVEPYIILWRLVGGEANYDPYGWTNRTMAHAHKYLIDHWREVTSGDVVDVEFILGESQAPKRSERLGETNIVRTLQEGDRFIP